MSIKQMFRTQYIGSIVMGMLTFQAATQVVGIVGFLIGRIFGPANRSVLAPAQPFPWDSLVNQAVNVTLNFGAAWLLYRWTRLGEPLEVATAVEERTSEALDDGFSSTQGDDTHEEKPLE